MPKRLRLIDFRLSSGPSDIGICQADILSCANAVNSAQERLIYCKERSDEGWYGTWAEVSFLISPAKPYVTLPRQIARLQDATVCERPIQVKNQWWEYLRFGTGRLPKLCSRLDCGPPVTTAYERNNAVTAFDLTGPPQLIAVFPTDPADVEAARRVLIQGRDSTDSAVYSQDGLVQIEGKFVFLESPFSVTTVSFNSLSGLQKDVTNGPVQIFQMNPVTGEQKLLLTMEPSETVAGYRRYYFNALPNACCASNNPTIPVTAMAQLDLIPVVSDTDYLLLHSLEAVINECQSLRYSKMDTANSQQLAAIHHQDAVRLLNGQLVHFEGRNTPAIQFRPFGSAELRRLNIAMK